MAAPKHPAKETPLRLNRRQWESLCRRCGLCCFEKHIDHCGQIHTTREACRYLDVVERSCRVYHKRFDTGEECLQLTPAVVRAADWLPPECAYRLLLREHPELRLEEDQD